MVPAAPCQASLLLQLLPIVTETVWYLSLLVVGWLVATGFPPVARQLPVGSRLSHLSQALLLLLVHRDVVVDPLVVVVHRNTERLLGLLLACNTRSELRDSNTGPVSADL